MKNIIKRGTSLLLVLAMLLSFAAVVGAEGPTTTTSEKILTLTVGNVVLEAGQEKYIPVKGHIASGYSIGTLNFSISCTNGITVTGVTSKNGDDLGACKKVDGSFSSNVSRNIYTWFPNTEEIVYLTEKYNDTVFFWIKVKAASDLATGSYTVQLTKTESTPKLFAIIDENNNQIDKTVENATLNPGTAVVIPASAELPTVILTKTAFEAPTQAGLAAGGEAAGDYDLTKYVKLVTEEGLVDVTSLSVMVNGDKSVSLKQGNVLSLATTAEKDKGYKLTVTAANGKQLAAAVELPFTVSKQDSAFTMAGFTKNGGYSMDFAGPYEAPAYSGTTANKFVPLDPKAYDQYGMPMGQATTELKLYSDAACTKEITSGNAFESVTVSESTGSVQISKNLRADVWCKVRASATIDGVTKTSDWITFQIKSNYPQPRKAILSLTDGSGNPFSGDAAKGTFDIPGGSGRTTIKFAVDKFLDKNGGEMTSATAPMGYTVSAVDPSVGGVTVDNTNKTIEVTSEAVKSAPVEIEIKVTLADNTELTGILKVGTEELPAKITLKKGNSFAIALASYDSDSNSYAKGEIRADSYEGNALPTVLPGIGGDKASVVLAPLYVLDQYDAVMQMGVAAANYKLYKVDGETKTPISADYAKFEDGIEGRVTLKLMNALTGEEGAKSLALTAGNYQIEATYNNKTAIANFTMAEATEKTYVATVTAEITTNGYTGDKSVKTLPVPYAHGGTSQQRQTPEITYTATVTDQYGKTPADGTNVVAKITSIKLGTSQADYINDNSSKFIVTNGTTNAAKLQVTKELATVMNLDAADSVVVHVGLTVTVDGKPATVESVPDYTFTTDEPKLGSLGVYLRTDENTSSALGSWSSNATNNPEALTVVAPAGEGTTRNVLDFAVYDQYRRSNGFAKALTKGWLVKGDLPTGMTFGDKSLTAGSIYEVTVTKDAVGKTFTITAPAAKNVAGTDWTVKVTAVAVEFVNGEGSDATRYELSDYLTNDTFSAEYNGQPWSTILAKNPDAKVYIKTAEGESNTEISSDKLTLEVTKDGAPVGMDAKANAGSYQVKLVYTDENKQTYTVDEKTFTITPKTVKITANGAITKEYDGTANLPDATLAVTAYETLNVDKSVLKFAQENVGTDINVELTSAGTNCLKTASGEPATNYTADLSELKGTIAPRKLIVTPKAKTFEYGENDKITNALTTEFDYAGKNGDLPSGLTPTITGSMKLTTTSGADVTVYNAGTYKVVNNNLSAGTNYEIEFPATSVQWTINRKLLTKVKNSGLPQSMFGTNTDKGCISRVLESLVIGEDVAWKVSDFVDASALSFPSNTVYVTGQNGTQYPAPGPYMLNVTKPKKDIGKNYRVDETTVYEFDYTVNKLDASLLTVTLTEDTYTYNGMEQGPTVSVTYTNRANDTLDLTSSCTIGGTTKATDAGTYTITVTSDLVSGSKTVTWKIDPKMITEGMFTQKSDHPVYDGTEQTLTGSVLDGKDSEITVNGENKVLKLGTDFTAAEVKQTNAGEYTMTVTGQGNYTGTADVKVKIDKYKGRVYTEIDKLQKTTVEVTRGQSVEYEILTDVVLHEQELVATLENEKIGKIGYQIYGDGGNMAGIENPRIEVTGDKKLLFKATVTNQVEVGRKFRITFENSLDNENIKSRLVLTIYFVVTEKPEQKDFQIVEGSEGTYSYSQGGLQLTTTGSEKGSTVSWSSSNTEFATVDNTGKVTFVKPTTTAGVIITATASETSAPNALFKATERTYRLTITKGQVTITASSATMTANDPLPGFSATASGLNLNDSVSEVFQTLTASAATDGKTAGTFRVTPNATFKTGGRKNWSECYDLYFVAGTLTVNPAQTAIDVVLPIIIGGNTCANGYANCACESFYDLDASRWYHEAIDWAYSLGLMNGTTKSTFGPNAAATRAQTWTMLARIAGQDTRRSSTWYEVGQKWAMNLGITDGTNPMGSLTREQLAAMLYRYVGSPAVNGTLTFTDSANVSAWARNAMIWAVQNGILDGVGGNRLNPKGTTTRAQAAAIFMRFSKLINK